MDNESINIEEAKKILKETHEPELFYLSNKNELYVTALAIKTLLQDHRRLEITNKNLLIEQKHNDNIVIELEHEAFITSEFMVEQKKKIKKLEKELRQEQSKVSHLETREEALIYKLNKDIETSEHRVINCKTGIQDYAKEIKEYIEGKG